MKTLIKITLMLLLILTISCKHTEKKPIYTYIVYINNTVDTIKAQRYTDDIKQTCFYIDDKVVKSYPYVPNAALIITEIK